MSHLFIGKSKCCMTCPVQMVSQVNPLQGDKQGAVFINLIIYINDMISWGIPNSKEEFSKICFFKPALFIINQTAFKSGHSYVTGLNDLQLYMNYIYILHDGSNIDLLASKIATPTFNKTTDIFLWTYCCWETKVFGFVFGNITYVLQGSFIGTEYLTSQHNTLPTEWPTIPVISSWGLPQINYTCMGTLKWLNYSCKINFCWTNILNWVNLSSISNQQQSTVFTARLIWWNTISCMWFIDEILPTSVNFPNAIHSRQYSNGACVFFVLVFFTGQFCWAMLLLFIFLYDESFTVPCFTNCNLTTYTVPN